MKLPDNPDRAWCVSFWLSSHATALLLFSPLIAAAFSPVASIAFACTLALTGLLGLVRTEMAEQLYRLWNRLAGAYVRIATTWTSAICFFMVVAPASKTKPGGGRSLSCTTDSFWSGKATQGMEMHVNGQCGRGRWVGQFVSWSRRSGNLWAASLLPFIGFLRLLSTEEDNSLSDRLYTLY